MAKLTYDIAGTNTGLAKAVNDSISLLQNLQLEVNKLGKGATFTGLGSAISGANNQALQLNKTLKDTNLSAQDKGGIAALDALGRKLLIIKGNADLFGDSIKNQQSELTAYQGALNKLLSLGFEPLDGDVIKLKANIDSLTQSIVAQNAVSIKRPQISNSIEEATAFNNSSNTGGSVASSGTNALIRDLNADLDAGKISAIEYKAAIDQIGISQARFAQQAGKTNAQLVEEEGLLLSLNTELKALQAAKINIINPSDIAKQNLLIQELEAEIGRLNNVGKVGFDSSGVAIKGFGKNIQESTDGVNGLGKSLTKGLSSLRTIAYILPGIGIAGIFNLAFEGISKAAESLDLFSSKLTLAENNLANLNEVSKNASKQYGEQSTNLKVLYQATQDVNNSEHNRLLAAQELQKEFPSLFGNIKTETILNGGAADAYRNATTAILDNAKAKAAATKISELAGKQLEAEFQIQKIKNAQANETARDLETFRKTAAGALTFNAQQKGLPVPTNAQINSSVALLLKNQTNEVKKRIDERAKTSLQIQEQNKKDLDAQIKFITDFAGGNNKIASALSAGEKIKSSGGINESFDNLQKQLDEIAKKNADAFDKSGLTGYALDVQNLVNFYSGLNSEIENFITKVKQQETLFAKSNGTKGISKTAGDSLINSARQTQSSIGQGFNKGLSEADIKESQRVANEIQRINDEFGVKAEQSRGRELAQIQARYDAEVVKANGNVEILKSIDAGRLNAVQAVNDKYLAIQQDLQDRIILIDEQAQAEIGDKTSVETGKIVKEWETRRLSANKYYDELVKIGQSNDLINGLAGFNVSGLVANVKRDKTNTNITNAENADINLAKNRDLLSGLQNATTGFISDFLSGLENANSQIGANFASVFAGITTSFAKTMESVAISGIGKFLQNKLEEGIKNGTKGLSSAMQGAIAGAAIAGGLISGVTSKTSVVGQGLGGALSGAASGAVGGFAIAGPAGVVPGLIIGGVVGLLGGIFGASKAQKELQAQQLAEQKQQTDLLKASLAYTANIIGRNTNQGVITDLNVGAFGQLTARISGRDLQFVLDRNSNGR